MMPTEEQLKQLHDYCADIGNSPRCKTCAFGAGFTYCHATSECCEIRSKYERLYWKIRDNMTPEERKQMNIA